MSNFITCLTFNSTDQAKTSYTYKLLWTWKVEQLYHSKVITRDDIEARVGDAGTRYVSFVCVAGPNSHNLIPQYTAWIQTHSNKQQLPLQRRSHYPSLSLVVASHLQTEHVHELKLYFQQCCHSCKHLM